MNFLFSKIWATITHVQFTITSRSYVYYIFLVRKWTNETTFSNFLAYSNGWEANFKNEILQNNKILKYYFIIICWKVCDTALTLLRDYCLLNLGIFIWRALVWISFLWSTASIDPLLIQNGNVCFIFLLLDCLLLDASRCLIMVYIAEPTVNACRKEHNLLRWGMGNWIDTRCDPVWGFAGVDIFDFIWSLAPTTLNTWSCHWQGYHRIFWGRWFRVLLLAMTLLGICIVHRVPLIATLSRLLEIALATVDLIFLRYYWVILSIGWDVLSLKLSLIISFSRVWTPLIVFPFNSQLWFLRLTYFCVFVLLIEERCGLWWPGTLFLISTFWTEGRSHAWCLWNTYNNKH